ncbi:MAG: TonB-dependent receptor [Paludibacteraceae bacterium]|nr:TonB-dependent receptor [Paludibacteraceae bacterium]
MDKLVMNVADSPFAMGSNGQDLLKKAPGVNIDKDGNVTVNGKSVNVYVDSRPSNLNGEQLKAMLQGTDGSTIDKIEIISNPSAKYDAAGQGGIINIKTKRNMTQGFNGSLMASYGGMYYGDIRRYLQNDYLSFNLNYRTDKTYTSATLSQVYDNGAQTLETGSSYLLVSGKDTTAMRRVSRSKMGSSFQYYVVKAGNDWFIDPKNTIGFIVDIPVMKAGMSTPLQNGTGTLEKQAGTTRQTTETLNTSTAYTLFTPQHNINLNYTHIFCDSLERELTVNADYNRHNQHSINSQSNIFKPVGLAENTSSLDISTRQLAQIYSAKADFQTQFWGTGMLETGVKWVLSTTGNHMTTDSTINSMSRPQAHSDFEYNEHIAALYITAGKQFGKHWNIKLGIRGEYTFSAGNWVTADSTTRRSYFNLFPTAFVGYNPTDKWSLGLSYTRRIDRPGYWQFNPFVVYIDAHSYMEGNPDLQPQFTHSLELQTGYSQYVSLTFSFSQTSGSFAQRTTVLNNGDSRMRWENFCSETSVGANLGLTELPLVPKYATGQDGSRTLSGAWLALTLNGGYFYHTHIHQDGAKKHHHNHHWGNASATLTGYLPQNWVVSADGYYNAPQTEGYDYMDAFYGMNFAVKKNILSKGLVLSLQVQDLLRSMHFNSHSIDLPEGYGSYINNHYYGQKVMLSVVWMFGTQQYIKRRNVGGVDESSRLGSGNSTGGISR